ncbi:hypothetical protein EV421DRAFT_1897819 [Armillaria borealis]|uniref:F-box domain-containing protein n=1 Tax=Armillaria borealis TaxID=47425 RepID=A0AA39K3D1_9AGAR|nr:hypothetical protein EV421DRAFT_1897819 [Armillaria borealis]
MQIHLYDLPEAWPVEFLRLLKSNEPPTKAQVMSIQPVLAHARENMAILIHAAQKLQGTIDDCKAIISPIRQLPPEILLEIFLWINADRAPVDVFSMTSIPCTLGLVCRQWRGIVRSTTGFWSNILVKGFSNDRHGPVPRNRLRLLEQALALSNGKQLSIRCSLDSDGLLEIEKERNAIQEKWPIPNECDEDTTVTALNREVLRLLVRESQRWKDVCFRIDDYADLPILNDARGKMDQLTTLSFGMIPGWIESRPNTLFNAFEVAPKLRNVELSRMGHVVSRLPRQQLVSVREEWYDHDSLDEHLKPLCEMPNLQGYDLDGFDYELSSHASIQHNALRVLHACTPGAFTSLAASFDDACRFTTLHKLPGLIDRSRCSIRKLILSDVMESEDLIPVLERTPNLNELHVEQNHWHFDGNQFIARVAKHLRIREDGQIPLPKLHTLTISVRGSPKWDVPFDLPMTFLKRKTAEMIRDRWNMAGGSAVGRLRFVRIYISVPSKYHIAPYDEFVEGLRGLQEDGLNISVSIIGGDETLYQL